jgi:hypothetical protein
MRGQNLILIVSNLDCCRARCYKQADAAKAVVLKATEGRFSLCRWPPLVVLILNQKTLLSIEFTDTNSNFNFVLIFEPIFYLTPGQAIAL